MRTLQSQASEASRKFFVVMMRRDCKRKFIWAKSFSYMVEILISFFVVFFVNQTSWAAEFCPADSCSQSHVSTAGRNIFSPGCTAQFANEGCNGQPLAVATNTCIDRDVLDAYWAEKDDGKELPPGRCGPARDAHQVSCHEACAQVGYRYGRCRVRPVLCFGEKRQVGYCFCG